MSLFTPSLQSYVFDIFLHQSDYSAGPLKMRFVRVVSDNGLLRL